MFLRTSYLSVFSPNAGKCGPEKTQYFDTFHTVKVAPERQKFLEVTKSCANNKLRPTKIRLRKIIRPVKLKAMLSLDRCPLIDAHK